MKQTTFKVIAVVTVMLLTLVLAAGSALADGGESDPENGGSNHLAQMVERMGQENWGQMIQRMIQVHGPEETAQMLQRMSQNDMPCEGDGVGHGMGRGFGGMYRGRLNHPVRSISTGMMAR